MRPLSFQYGVLDRICFDLVQEQVVMRIATHVSLRNDKVPKPNAVYFPQSLKHAAYVGPDFIIPTPETIRFLQ